MNWSGRNVLITGGAGHIGSHLTATLIEKGANVVWTHPEESRHGNSPDGNQSNASFLQQQSLQEQYDEFIHCDYITLKHKTGLPIAIMDIRSDDAIYQPNLEYDCEIVFGVYDIKHPYIKFLKQNQIDKKI